MIQELSCILTSTRLVIVTKEREESLPLQNIAAIDVYDDNEKYHNRVRREKKKRLLMTVGISFLYSAALSVVCILRGQPELSIILMSVAMVSGIMVAFMFPSSVIKEAIVHVVNRHGETKQYRFSKVDIKAHLVKTFADKVFKVVCKPSKEVLLTGFLN